MKRLRSSMFNTVLSMLSVFAIVALTIPVPGAAQAHHHYKLIDLGTFGGPYSLGVTLNSSGVTVASAATTVSKVPSSNPLVCGGVDGIGSVVSVGFEWQNGVLTNLGALPGPSLSICSEPFSVNNQGIIVGTSENGEIDPLTGGNVTRAVMWKNGQISDLGSLGGNQNFAFWINNSGQIVGWGTNNVSDPFSIIDSLFFASTNGTQTRAFLWDSGKIRDLGTLGGSDAAASFINDLGQVAGTSYTSTIPNPVIGLPPADPFLWEPPSPGFPKGRMIDLGSFGGANGFSNALNNQGQVIGGSSIPANPGACFFLVFFPDCHPFLWSQGTLTDLNTSTVGGNPLTADWFTDATEIVGAADFSATGGSPYDAYLWRNGVATDLGHLTGDCYSRAWGINSLGQVVGDSLHCDSQKSGSSSIAVSNLFRDLHHAFLWENGSIVDLNTLIPPNSSLKLTETGPLSQVFAPDINDAGEIVGYGIPPGCPNDGWDTHLATPCGHAFLLIPCDANHPEVEGCDYSLVDASTTADVRPTQTIQSSAEAAPNLKLSSAQAMARFRSMMASRNRRWGNFHGPSPE